MTVRKGLGQANILRTNNNTSTGYGVAYADEISGHRTVANLTALYALHDWQLSASGDNTGSDAIGQLWYVVGADGKGNGALYQLKDWSKRKEAAGWSEFKGTGTSTAAASTEQEIIYDVSARNNGIVFESLSALLSSSNLSTLIPTSVRHGGMTIRFIQGSEQSSDNKYVQYRLMANTFSTTVTDWQGVDDEPTAGSDNLVKSGGVADSINRLKNAGYFYAGIATSTTDPSAPNAKVFYIANGKGTYEKFGGINVTEDDVVVLYYDTEWHKVSTGIASQEKLTELNTNVDDFKDGFSKNGNNIFDPISQLVKEGGYASILNGHIIFNNLSDTPTYKVFCIPVKESKKYIFSSKMRFVVPTMDDKYTATSSANIEYVTNIDLNLYPNTKYLFVSFNDAEDIASTLKISEGTEFIDGLILPAWIKNINFNDLKGKVTANMMDGYEKGNIFSSAELYKEGYYVAIIDGHIHTMREDSFNIYILPVDSLSKYTFTNVRFALPLAEDKYTALSETLIQNVHTIDMALYAGIKYIAFSFNKETYPLSSYIVSKGEILIENDIYPTWINEAIDTKIGNKKGKVPFLTTTRTTLTNGQYFVLPSSRTNLRKGMRVVATADVTGTGGFEIGFTISDKSITGNHNTMVINDTQAKFAKSGYTYEDIQNHGLTISGKIVVIFEYNANGTATYTILANGKSFKHTLDFTLQSVSAPYLMSNGATLTNCKLTLSCIDIEKKIWCFGDSYFAYSAERWTYYLREYGYDKNVLLDGFPGEGSVNGRVSFATLLSMGTPKYAIWFLGMNDGSDPNDTTPSTSWANNRDIFLSICNQHGMTPVFATIPNVPSINHNGKNAWIKASGYRYIDMCHAVGADVNVNWLGTMLSSDKIHPSEDGARALFAQVVQDFPEIMVVE